MTRRYDVRTGMIGDDPDAARPREELVPGWHVPGRTRYDYDLRIGDAKGNHPVRLGIAPCDDGGMLRFSGRIGTQPYPALELR